MSGGGRLLVHAVGDIGIAGRLADALAERPAPYPFQSVADRLSEADVVFGNLEIPFSGGAAIAAHESPKLVTPESAAERLAAAGVDVLSLANNHIMDFGPKGLEATRRLLLDRGIETVGAGLDVAEARRPLVVERSGVRLGFLAYCVPSAATAAPGRPGAAPLEIEIIREDLGALRPKVDGVIVSLHFGMMYLEHPTPEDLDLGRSVLAAGADLVLGHHPHVLQGIDRTPQGIIAYSLGEFVFDPQAGNYYARVARERRRRSMIFRAEVGARPPRLLPPLPTRAGDDLCPRALDGEEGAEALRSIDRLSAALHDPSLRGQFWNYAGKELLHYQLSGLWFEIRKGHVLHLLGRLPRLRPRHLKLVLGYLRSRLSAKRK